MPLPAPLRSLGRDRALAAAVVVTLALGVGALTAAFGVVDAALLRPPPFDGADRLTMLFLERTTPGEGPRRERWSFPRVRELRRAATSFERVANYSPVQLSIADAADPEPVRGEYASAAYFPLLRATPLVGRAFVEQEDGGPDGDGAPAPVVVLGHELWTRRYGADPAVVGRAVRVNGVALTVVGVMPAGFRGLTDRAELWVPTAIAPRLTYADYLTSDQAFISAVGRLRPGASLGRADAELRVLGARADAAWPGDDREPGERVAGVAVPLNEARVDARARRALLVLAAGVAALHLLACANVASLLLGRAAARRREGALRLALGSTPARLFRHVLAEGSALAAAGAAAGVAVAALALRFVAVPTDMWGGRNFYGSVGLFDTPSFDARTLAFGVALGAATALLVAWPPAAAARRADVGGGLREGARGASRDAVTLRRPSARGVIVALEAALATVLLVAAGLLLESFARMRRAELGVDPSRVLTFLVMPSETRIPTAEAPAFVKRLLDAVERVPGVVSASVDGGAPVSGSARSVLHVLGRPVVADRDAPRVLRHYVAPAHFRTLGVPLLRGRAFDAGDVAGRPRVAVISETAARRFWPGEDPIGQRVWFGGSGYASPDSSAEIVGVVGDVVYEPLDANPNRASFYTPYAQFTYAWRMVFVRTDGDPAALVTPLRRAVASVDPDLPLREVMPLGQRIGDSWARRRFDATLFGAFGAAALLLAASGIYAVVAHAVAQRTREMGVRAALGASRGDVVRLVVREGMALPAIGLVAGVAAALALGRLLRASLYEVAPTEPRVFAAGVAVLLGAALLACLVPARRATRVDPLEALRAD